MISPAEMQALLQHMVFETGITRLQKTVSLAGLLMLCVCSQPVKVCTHIAVIAAHYRLLVFKCLN